MKPIALALLLLAIGCKADPVALPPKIITCHQQMRFAVLDRFAGEVLTNEVASYRKAGWTCDLQLTANTWQQIGGNFYIVSHDIYACHVEQCDG